MQNTTDIADIASITDTAMSSFQFIKNLLVRSRVMQPNLWMTAIMTAKKLYLACKTNPYYVTPFAVSTRTPQAPQIIKAPPETQTN